MQKPDYHSMIKDLKDSNPDITSYEIAKQIGISDSYVRNITSRLTPIVGIPRIETPKFNADDIYAWFKNAMPEPKPLKYAKPQAGAESVIDLNNDWHIGAELTDEYGKTIFNMKIAKKIAETICSKKLSLIDGYMSKSHKFDEYILLINGDMVEGEGIFQDQYFSLETDPPQQVMYAFDVLRNYILAIRKAFPKMPIRVIANPGNHGKVGGKHGGFNPRSNWDLMLYRMLSVFLEVPNLTVSFREVEHSNFEVKGWAYHMRHRAVSQIETAGGSSKFRGWVIDHKAKVIIGGHFHHYAYTEDLDHIYIMGSALKGKGDLEERMAKNSMPSQLLWGCSKSRPVTFFWRTDAI